MLKIFKKYFVYFSFLTIFGCLFLNNYINSQDFINETGIIWYQKYMELNMELFNNPIEGIKMLFNSITTDTRNYLFALFLSPIYLFFKNSYKAYVFGNFFLFFIPTIIITTFFINKYILKNCQEIPWFKYITLIILSLIPLFWWMVPTGYPDMFSLGIFICALIIFEKYPFDKQVPFKFLLLFSFLLYFSFVFRRWYIFCVISILLSIGLYYALKYIYKLISKNISLNDFKQKAIQIFKNLFISGFLFSFFIFLFQNDIFKEFFNPDLKAMYDGYKFNIETNIDIFLSFFSIPIYILIIISVIFSLFQYKKSKWIIFPIINVISSFFIFNYIQTFCYDHITYFLLWIYIIIIVGLYNCYICIKNKNFSIIFLLTFLTLFSMKFIHTTIFPLNNNWQIFSQNTFLLPKKVKNTKQIKQIEKDINKKIEKDEKYTYSIWAFEEQVFNTQLFFQEDIIKFRKGQFPPLVDIEAILSNWYFFWIIKCNEIYTIEPLGIYLKKEDSRILFRTAEMLKNKEGFGKSYVRSSEEIQLETGQKVIKYTRIKPLTKEEEENYKQEILKMYPNSEKYFPDYFKDLYLQ